MEEDGCFGASHCLCASGGVEYVPPMRDPSRGIINTSTVLYMLEYLVTYLLEIPPSLPPKITCKFLPGPSNR
jgi:hypothetical protein